MSKGENAVSIAIIGAGVGGITAAISLQHRLGFQNYSIYEMASDVGGTWRQNTYPGCACDIPAHWYSLSTDPNPEWKWIFAPRDEIQAYWKKLSTKHQVEPRIEYETKLVSAVWSDENQYYTLTLQDVKTQTTRQVTAQVVISAIGVFHVPKWPSIPGRELFKGDMLHAQHWDHTVNLSGKRVAVIGNGCAGSQIVPAITNDGSTQAVQFCRTPSWYVPRPQVYIPDWLRWTFRNVPFTLKSFRWIIASSCEILYQNMKQTPFSKLIRRQLEKWTIYYIKRMTPAKYHEKLIPNYPLGCKRIIFDPEYLTSLNRPNVELEWDPIVEIVPQGIVTKSGKIQEFDAICFATGFDVEGSYVLDVKGVGEQTLQEYYDREGGPTGYMGTTIPGFPNWVTVFGPNTATGHASVIFAEEVQMNYAAQLLKPILQGKARSFAPRAEATRTWNDWVQSQLLGNHIWSSCLSWYRGGDQQGKVVALWPGSTRHMWWSFRKPIWENFEFVGGEDWLRRKRTLEKMRFALSLGALGVGLAAYINTII